jgi:hypothetical protein
VLLCFLSFVSELLSVMPQKEQFEVEKFILQKQCMQHAAHLYCRSSFSAICTTTIVSQTQSDIMTQNTSSLEFNVILVLQF